MTEWETEEIINDIDHILRDIEKIENIKIVGNTSCYNIENVKNIECEIEEAINALMEAKYYLRELIDKKEQGDD